MNRIIGVTDLQRNFRAVFDEVARKGVPYVLTRGSRPEVVMIPYDAYLRYVELDEAGVLARFDQARERLAIANAVYSDDEIEADLKDAADTVRSRGDAAL
ncbi:MAG: type II toxin-antitoxin system Phd/YefM family antitoxin [Chloroflexi bacterium]|nr:type II toxin-antitoxin system Phd/YefM family antitoxin [Chloroflexota bacterium]